jgi:hypothetical protein
MPKGICGQNHGPKINCARMTSTQRSESANFMLKRFVPRYSSMSHFVTQYTRLLFDRDREEDIAEDKTKQVF